MKKNKEYEDIVTVTVKEGKFLYTTAAYEPRRSWTDDIHKATHFKNTVLKISDLSNWDNILDGAEIKKITIKTTLYE